MKKVVLIASLGLMAIGFNACKKDVAPALVQSTDYDGVTTDGKMLIFESVEDYEHIMNDLSAEKELLFSNKLSSLGYNNYFSVERLEEKSDNESAQEMDEFFGKLLNEDGAIQIGGHVFKIDLETEQVFVIAKENVEDDYADLISGNTMNTNVSVYSVDQEVIYLVNGEVGEKCGGIGGGHYVAYPDASKALVIGSFGSNPVVNVRLNCGVKMWRAGVWFRLGADYMLINWPNNGTFNVEIQTGGIQNRRWYKKRPCKSGDTNNGHTGLYMWGSKAKDYKNYYQGTRNLNGYYFFVRGRGKNPDGSYTDWTPWAGRNINSPY